MGKELNNILGTRSLVEWLGTLFVCTPATLNGKEGKLIHLSFKIHLISSYHVEVTNY